MGANEIQIFVIKFVKSLGQNCSYYVRSYSFHSCILLSLFVLCKFFPRGFVILAYSFPVVAFAFLVHKAFVSMDRPKVKCVGTKSKRWKELQSRRSFRSLNRVRAPNQYNESSFMYNPPGARQNAKETSNRIPNDMSAEDKDIVFSAIFNDNSVDKRALVEENSKEIREVMVGSVLGRVGSLFTNASQPLMPANHYRFDEGYRKCSFDYDKDKVQKSLVVCEDEKEQNKHGKKTVRWMEEEEKSLMDLGISEVERTKRLENLMARRRSRKLSSFPVRNNSCGQISSLLIPKKNPFLADNSRDQTSPAPGSAPSYMVEQNPFDLPYDPHEEKPILTGDSFKEEFMATHQKEPIFYKHARFCFGKFAPPEFTNYKHQTFLDSDFAIKQLTPSRLGISTVANKEDDGKQPPQNLSIPNNDNHAVEEDESSEKVVDVANVPDEAARTKADDKVVDVVEAARTAVHSEEQEANHDASGDESSSSSSSSEDEPILRPNKEAILHCLSLSRMRVASQRNNFHRHAESFDCGPSALFDKTKTDCFFFAGNKRIHYGSTNSIASDMQVEVSEVGSPLSTNISSLDEEGKGSLVNSTNPSEMDLNDARLRDIDEFSDQDSTETGISRQDLDPDPHDFEKLYLTARLPLSTPASISSSPKSMLQTEVSIDRSSLSKSCDQRADVASEQALITSTSINSIVQPESSIDYC